MDKSAMPRSILRKVTVVQCEDFNAGFQAPLSSQEKGDIRTDLCFSALRHTFRIVQANKEVRKSACFKMFEDQRTVARRPASDVVAHIQQQYRFRVIFKISQYGLYTRLFSVECLLVLH